jgi:TolA-binding protein
MRSARPRTPEGGFQQIDLWISVGWRLLARTLVIPAMVAVSLTAAHAEGVDYSQTATEVLSQTADMLTMKGDWTAAYPVLEELVKRFGELKDAGAIARLEGLYYNLAIAAKFSNQNEKAITALEQYLARYPKGRKSKEAMDLLGDAYFEQESYEMAAEVWERLRSTFKMPPVEGVVYLGKIADAKVKSGDWTGVIPVLLEIKSSAPGQTERNRAITLLVQAYIESGQPGEILDLLPVVAGMSSGPRLDVEFNLALIRGGDALLGEGQAGLALLLYSMAMTKEALLDTNAAEGERLEAVKTAATANRQPLAVLSTVQQIKKLEAQNQLLEEIPSYTEELRMRVARVYFDRNQKWEAFWAFYEVYHDFPETPFSEDALHAAFLISAELGMTQRSVDVGRLFLEKFPKSKKCGEVAPQLGQLLLEDGKATEAIALFDGILGQDQDARTRESLDQILFLNGYAHFQNEECDQALKLFLRLRVEFPQSSYREMGDYWTAMTYLFLKDYATASQEFSDFLLAHPGGRLAEDAAFRLGVCDYGNLDFAAAQKKFLTFLANYPKSGLAAEAHMFLGDIAAAEGAMEQALEEYRAVPSSTENQSMIDYAAFQVAKIHEELGDFAAMASDLKHYLRTYGDKGNYTEAVYRIGFAQKEAGDIEGMLSTYGDAVREHAPKRDAIGIDFIMDEWPQEYRGARGQYPIKELAGYLEEAREKKLRSMELRIYRVMETIGVTPDRPLEFVEGDLEESSPAVLLWVASRSQTPPDLALKALQRVENLYGQTEYVKDATLKLAARDEENQNFGDAIGRYQRVAEKFASLPEGGEAIKRHAQVLMKQKRYDEAVVLLEKILGTPDYKGPLFPECLYLIAECKEQLQQEREATAYLERIYVLYAGNPEWTAKAYLKRAQLLEKLHAPDAAADVYKEMLAQSELGETKEFALAGKRLKEMGK